MLWTHYVQLAQIDGVFRCLKSELGIRPVYHRLEHLAVAPDEALFLDDREANVRAAEALGIAGIVARNTAQIRRDLQAIGFSPLPS